MFSAVLGQARTLSRRCLTRSFRVSAPVLDSKSNSQNNMPNKNTQQPTKNTTERGGAGQGKGPGNAGGWPSTTGNPSGVGRSNNPPRKQK
ncbi:hypothetical protein ACA910_001808 [Epithemia clementina (nom. ined.)]